MPIKRVSEKEIVVSAAVPARHKPATTKHVKQADPYVGTETSATQPGPDAPTQEQIACLAYSYWEARGCQGGSSEEDWLRAEQELAAAATA